MSTLLTVSMAHAPRQRPRADPDRVIPPLQRDTQLYAHDPLSLLPLLEQRQPYSLPTLACILANQPLAPPQTHANGSSKQAGSDIDLLPLKTAYANFPPGQHPAESEHDWVVALALPAPSKDAHVWHALESVHPDAVTSEDIEFAGRAVVAALQELRVYHPLNTGVSGLNTMWAPAVRAALGVATQPPNAVFIAPPGALRRAISIEGINTRELVIDSGRPGDEDYIHDSSPGHYSRDYYLALMRRGRVTAVRPAPSSELYLRFSVNGIWPGGQGSGGPGRIDGRSSALQGHGGRLSRGEPYVRPLAWVVTHANGSLGALYTVPQHRRRGLSRLVSAQRCAATPWRAFAYVDAEEAAGHHVWEGWVRSWEVTWVSSDAM